jgi:DNA-binding SARP family transcriptional activator
MSLLSLSFLGAPQVRHSGRLVTFRTRKALGLLIYLAVAGGTHSRGKLTALFWPESPEEQGRASLRNTLVYLRNALQEESDTPHLIIERDSLGFNFNSEFKLDLNTLQAAFKQPNTLASGQSQEERSILLAKLQAAVVLYRGDFLDGFFQEDSPDFDDWLLQQRTTWHQRVSSVLDRLSELQFGAGEMAGGYRNGGPLGRP